MQENQIWKILLIDDDEDDYLITREMLADTKGARVQLSWASTYDAARKALFGEQTFDAVLVDYDLGLHTGLDLIRETTAREPAPPMILLTGRGSYEVDLEAMQAGASLYLTKNEVNPLLLERSIRYAMDRKHAEQDLKQANAALRESEERFRRLVSVMPAAMYTCDREGRLTYYNQKAVEIWGSEPPLGDPTVQFCGGNRLFLEDGMILPHDQTPMAKAVKEGVSTRGAEVQLERPDGSMLTVSVNIDPLYDAAGCISGAVNVFVDVSEKKKAAELLREQKHELQVQKMELEMKNQQLEGLFEHAPAALALFLAQPPYMVLAHNQVYQNMWNAPHRDESLVGKYIPDYVAKAEESGIFQIFEEVAKTGKGRTVYHFPYNALESGPKWWNWNLSPVYSEGKVVAFAHMLVDATEEVTAQRQMWAELEERRRTEENLNRSQQALVHSEERLRVLADSMPQLVWMADENGKVVYYNRRAAEYHGISEKPDGWEWAPVVHDDDLQATVDAWSYAVETGTMYEVEHRVRMADGHFRWHLSRGVPSFDEEGKITQWYGTATDIHEQKLTEAELRQRESQLELLVKSVESSNRDLERFAFVASHDLQEPLRKVRAFGDRLRQALQDRLSEQEVDYLNRMENATARMQGMIDDLLQLSRVSASKSDFGPVDLNSVMRDVLSDLRARIERCGGSVSAETLPVVQGDRTLLRQLLLHLVDNAIKFRQENDAPLVKLRAQREGSNVLLVVEDNGIGFDPAYADRIFQPFSRLHSIGTFEGSGMGLAICRKIVERHQGQITASSRPGVGSRFEITLPAIQPAA